MALIFPVSPTLGDTYTDPTSGVTYVAVKGGTPAEWVSSADSGSGGSSGGFDFDKLAGTSNFAAMSSGYPSVSAINGSIIDCSPKWWGQGQRMDPTNKMVEVAYPDHFFMPTQQPDIGNAYGGYMPQRAFKGLTFLSTDDDQSAIVFSGVLFYNGVNIKRYDLQSGTTQPKGPRVVSGVHMRGHLAFYKTTDPDYNNASRGLGMEDTVILDNSIMIAPSVSISCATLEDTTTSHIAVGLGAKKGGDPSTVGLFLNIQNASLNAASVSKILVDCDKVEHLKLRNTALDFMKIQLDGGTSAGINDLTPEATAARSSLIAKGFTIILNP